ncbi:MAG: hypothetical protein PV362_04775 [Providencia heimbachae]|nr:hypothetical protein [Providencia heimbachae]
MKSFFSKKIKCDFTFKEIDGFFGFHDRPSINKNGQLLVHKEIGLFEGGIGRAVLGVVDINHNSNNFREITITNTCNYQQGSLATWLTDESIILNNHTNDKKKCQIFNISGDLIKEFPFHFFSASKCGRYVTSLSFARFGNGLNGYGYTVTYSQEETNDSLLKTPKTEFGEIFIYDLTCEKILFTFNVVDLLSKSKGLLLDGYLYFSHSNFSPDSKFLYFLLRSSNNKINTSQLIIYDIDNKKTIYAPTNGMVSHLDWLSSNEIIAYCNSTEFSHDGYFIFKIMNSEVEAIPITIPKLASDGHPSSISNKKFITDTYPNRNRHQHLIFVDIENKIATSIARLFSPIKFRGVNRVDLHPRVSHCKKYLTIDSSFSGKRVQLVIDLSSNELNKFINN